MKMRTFFFFSVFVLVAITACDDKDDDRIEGYQKVEATWNNCISEEQSFIENLKQVKGEIIAKSVEMADRYIEYSIIKDSDGIEYLPCESSFLDDNIGAEIIFSGETYSGDPLSNHIPVVDGPFLRITALWIKE